MNPLFEQLNGPNSLMGQFQSFMSNPIGYLIEKKINIPQQYMNDPQQAVNYLISSGQMDQQTLNNLRARAGQMGFKF